MRPKRPVSIEYIQWLNQERKKINDLDFNEILFISQGRAIKFRTKEDEATFKNSFKNTSIALFDVDIFGKVDFRDAGG